MESASIYVICWQFAMVRWVNPVMAFAMFLAFFAIFAVRLRWAFALKCDGAMGVPELAAVG